MKKLLNILLMPALLVMALSVASCSDDDDNNGPAPEPVQNAQAVPSYGSVMLTWDAPADSNVYYIKVSYVNSEGKTINQKVHVHHVITSDSIPGTYITGFPDTNTYTFTLTNVSYQGASSTPVEVSAAPMDGEIIKEHVMESLEYEDIVEGGCFTWKNETGFTTQIVVTYTDQDGKDRTVTIDASNDGKRNITGITKPTTFTVYAMNPITGTKTESKTYQCTPKVDPDDVVDPSIEYLKFTDAGSNNITFVQDNPDNATQYTFTTIGGDPYCYAETFAKQIPGLKIKFRYQLNRDDVMEFFWANGPLGAAGGKSTKFNLEATDVWTTYEQDFTGDPGLQGWSGQPGNTIRFDVGNNGGIVMKVRNMHFE